MLIIATSLLLTILITFLYIYFKISFSYWKKRGLPYINPTFLFGNVKAQLMQKLSFAEQFAEFYHYFKSKGYKHGGIYMFSVPLYMPIDPEIIKCIFQRDFVNFVNRGTFANEKLDPLSAHLFNLEDENWKSIRTKISPTFSSGKMKMMFETMIKSVSNLSEILKKHSANRTPVNAKELMSRLTIDVIGSCAFGVDCNSLENPNTEFIKHGLKFFDLSYLRLLKSWMFVLIRNGLLIKLGLRETDRETEKFFLNLVEETVNYRLKNGVNRNDFIQLLLEFRKKNVGKMSNGLTIKQIAAQCFVFFLAGFESTASTITFALLELALNENIQKQLRKDINETIQKHEGKITYESVMDMKYLDRVIHETLRKHSPLPATVRICKNEYKVPGTDVVLEPGTRVVINFSGIHYDPEFFPQPEKFDPDRFTDENKAKRPSATYLPFGDGPRYCVGARFGLLESKLAVLLIIKNYEVTLNEKTKMPIKYAPNKILSSVKGGVWLNISDVL